MGMMRTLFGPSREEIWKQLSAEIGAEYTPGDFWTGAKVRADHGQWVVTLDNYTVSTGKATVTYTRMRAPYINPDGFRFTIYRHGFFSELGKFMGMQDVTVGYEDFDRDFVIKGTDREKLRKLFANDRLRELISAQPNVYLKVSDDEGCFGTHFPEGVDELYFAVGEVIKDPQRLRLLFDLFSETLDDLCRMGSAYDRDPGIKL